MVKHNNVVPNVHFHKKWALRVKTWFNQPGRKQSRRVARAKKAAAIFPRPVDGLLRPVVRCPTQRYNSKQRLGRGFTFDEIKEAKLVGVNHPRGARAIGIAVDHRRRNRSEGTFQENVQRLKEYQAKLVLFPRRTASKKSKHIGVAPAEELEKATQLKGVILPLQKAVAEPQWGTITEEARKKSAYTTLRHGRADARLVGKRQVRMKKKAEAKAAKAAANKKE